jgi:hypothetical protein
LVGIIGEKMGEKSPARPELKELLDEISEWQD